MSSPDAESDIYQAAELASALQASLPRQVHAAPLGFPSKAPFKLLSLRETLLWRVADMAGAAVSLCQTDRAVPAAVLARAALETTAVLYGLGVMVARVVETHRVDEFDARAMRMLFGSRNRQTPTEAINILTHIDQMDRNFSGLRSWYDDMSEIAHPNYAGVMASYGKVDRDRYIVELGPRDWPKGMVGPALCACLEIARRTRDSIDRRFEEFSRLCHDLDVENEQDEGA